MIGENNRDIEELWRDLRENCLPAGIDESTLWAMKLMFITGMGLGVHGILTYASQGNPIATLEDVANCWMPQIERISHELQPQDTPDGVIPYEGPDAHPIMKEFIRLHCRKDLN